MIYVFLANGFEEIEALSVVDILRRADMEVMTVGVGSKEVTGSHNITILPDMNEDEVVIDNNIKAIVLPGGMPGVTNLKKSKVVQQTIDFCIDSNVIISAICAAPSILGESKYLVGKSATCFPGFEKYLLGANITENSVCIDDNIITAKGAGVANEFAFAIIGKLINKNVAKNIKETMQCQ